MVTAVEPKYRTYPTRPEVECDAVFPEPFPLNILDSEE
jgi:hypothetical protein